MAKKLSKVEVLTLIERHDPVVISALKRLYEAHQKCPIFIPADSGFLESLCEQIFWRQRDIETGALPGDVPLLSPKQIACARRMIQRYAEELTRIAHQRASGKPDSLKIGPTGRTHSWQQRPDCVWCGAESVTAYDGNPCCQCCMDYVISRQAPVEETEEYRDRLEEELERLSGKVSVGPTIMTSGGLAITGRNLRWQTAKEMAPSRTGLTPAMEEELAQSVRYGADRATGIVDGDPFEFEELLLSSE